MVHRVVYRPQFTETQRNKPYATHCCVRLCYERETGIEPATTSLGSNNAPVVSDNSKALTPTPSPVCTRVCTSKPENDNADPLETDQGTDGEGIDQGDPLAKLAAALLTLSPADRDRLAAMLKG